MALLEVSNLTVTRHNKALLTNVSLALKPGELVALVGPNGAGKTTLLRAILGLLGAPFPSAVRIAGKPLGAYTPREVAQIVGYVPQRLTVTFPYTVREFLEMSTYPVQGVVAPAPQAPPEVEEVLTLTQLESFAHRALSELSGGELQRVVLASALVQRPKLLLLDEPGASLDPKHTRILHELLSKLVSSGALSVLMVSHDINAALRHSSRIVALKQGEVRFDGGPSRFMDQGVLEDLFEVPFERVAAESAQVVVPRI